MEMGSLHAKMEKKLLAPGLIAYTKDYFGRDGHLIDDKLVD